MEEVGSCCDGAMCLLHSEIGDSSILQLLSKDFVFTLASGSTASPSMAEEAAGIAGAICVTAFIVKVMAEH